MSRRKRALSNNGIFTAEHIWVINDEVYIQNVKNAETLKSFQSIFEMHDPKIQWVILFYPNGSKDKYKGYINLHLELIKLPPKTSKIEIQYKMCITELNTEFESTAEITKKTYWCQWSPFLLKRYALKKINKRCTILVEIGITKMYDENGKIYISRDIPMKKVISEPQPPSLTTDGQIKNINFLNDNNKIHIKQSSSENNIPFETGLINIDEDDDKNDNNDEGDDILCDNDEKQQLLELKSEKDFDLKPIQNASRKLTTVSTLDLKVEIINDLLQIHDAKFVSLTKEIKEMQEMIFQINDKLEELKELNELNELNKKTPMLIPEISPMHTPIMKGLHKLSTSTTLDDDDDEKKESTINSLNQYKIIMNRTNVKNWLEINCLLPQYFDKFIENGIEDLSIVQLLTINELKEMGITKMGHKLKILHEIQQLKLKN